MRISRLAELAYVVELDSAGMDRLDFLEVKSLLPGLVDFAPAFGQVALFFEDRLPATGLVEQAFRALPKKAKAATSHSIPICFEFGEDFSSVCNELGLTYQEFKVLFVNAKYQVEAIGFTPGFPYMSGLPLALCKLPRRESPRARVPAGSIGVAESMCGIYPTETPGGWNLIGRTPLKVADMSAAYFRFQVGDLIRFEEIHEGQFETMKVAGAKGQ